MKELVSNCCGTNLNPWFEEPLCSRCGEWCEAEELPFESSEWFNDRAEASKLWIKCNVDKFGLGAARREIIKKGFTTDQIQRVSQILLNFN